MVLYLGKDIIRMEQHGTDSLGRLSTLTTEASSETTSRVLESRSNSRTNLFVSAALYCGDECCPAKIRNLSENGALIEAPVLPAAGSKMRLCRSFLVVTGEIVWRRGGKAGLKFDSAISVRDWLPGRVRGDQAAIDEIVHQTRMGLAHVPESCGSQAEAENRTPSQELESVVVLIERIADAFLSDPHVITHHGWKLQQLEVATQKIRRVAALKCSASD